VTGATSKARQQNDSGRGEAAGAPAAAPAGSAVGQAEVDGLVDEDIREYVVRGEKTMIMIFVTARQLILLDVLPRGSKFDQQYFIDSCFRI
jgi:hypothetical protein